jgi:hypothetical protein
MYIFQWKSEPPIQVRPSRAKTSEAVWKYAIKCLRPAGMTDDAEAERLIRKNGEVVEEEKF